MFKDGHINLEGGIGDRRGAQGNGEHVAGVERLVSRNWEEMQNIYFCHLLHIQNTLKTRTENII